MKNEVNAYAHNYSALCKGKGREEAGVRNKLIDACFEEQSVESSMKKECMMRYIDIFVRLCDLDLCI